jgi:hypothetical protein
MPSTIYQLFERAMVERKQITCMYERRYREICPYILGHKNGKEVALTYQFAGTNSKGKQVTGSWKCLYLSGVRNPDLRDGPWHGKELPAALPQCRGRRCDRLGPDRRRLRRHCREVLRDALLGGHREMGVHAIPIYRRVSRYLLAAPSPEEHQHKLRLACGNGLRADIWTKFKERFQIPQIIEFYAASEGTFSLFNIEGEPGAIGHVPAFLAPRFPAVIVRYDAEREQPYRDDHGHCVRCAANEIGEALGRISSNWNDAESRFEGYVNAAETERKILRNVFEDGDAWYRTGDLMRRDGRGFIYFVDRIGDTFRWKGENVSTLQVAEALSACPGVAEIVVYGVAVPGADGRAGMAAINAEPNFDLAALHAVATDRQRVR